MNGYDLSRRWFDFAFENRECKVQHTALYMWIIELNNRLGWKSEFGLPTNATMEGLGIGNRGTYAKTLGDLVEWNFIEIIQESRNQYQACIIKLCLFNNELAEHQALDQALNRHSIKHSTGITTSIASGTAPINKPLNNETFKPLNNETDDAERVVCEDFSSQQVKEKKETPSKVAQKVSPSLHAKVKELIESLNPGYYWQAKDGKAAKALIQKIKHRWQNKHGSEATDENVIESLRWMLSKLPEWYRDKWDTTVIESKFESIVKQITEEQKNGASGQFNRNDSPTGTGVSSRLQSAWELLAESRKANAS